MKISLASLLNLCQFDQPSTSGSPTKNHVIIMSNENRGGGEGGREMTGIGVKGREGERERGREGETKSWSGWEGKKRERAI